MNHRIIFTLTLALLGFTSSAFAQEGKTVTATYKDADLMSVVRDIEAQTELSLIMEADATLSARKVSVTWNGTPVAEALSQLFGPDYEISFQDSFVMIRHKQAKDSSSRPPKGRTVSGTVTDEDGQPVIGAGVLVRGTSEGTVTDVDGHFSITLKNTDAVLEISSIGFKTETIALGTRNNLKVLLHSDNMVLDELVVVGYGVQKKVNLTGSVATVDTKELEQRPVASATQALQGLDPSLFISQGTGSPESSQSLTIRGNVSVNSGSPLVLVDGVEMALRYVNPNDIASISILKDASASAIYGAKASAGVVLVTTKSGADKDGKTKVTFSAAESVITSTTSTDFITTGYDHVRLNNEFFDRYPNGNRLVFNDEEMQMLYDRRNDVTEDPSRPWVIAGSDGYWRYYGNFDWYPFLFNEHRRQQDYNVSLTGGSDKASWYVSGRYYDQEGMFNPDNMGHNSYSTYSFRANLNLKLTKRLSYIGNYAFAENVMTYPGSSNYEQVISQLHTNVSPVFVPYNPDGTIVTRVHQLSSSNNITVHRLGQLLSGAGDNRKDTGKYTIKNSLVFTILPGWTLTGAYSLNYQNTDNEYRLRNWYCGEGPGLITHVYNMSGSMRDYYNENHVRTAEQTAEVFSNFNYGFESGHNIAATAGMQYYTYASRSGNFLGTNMLVESLESLAYTSPEDGYTVTQSINALKTLGVFGRVNYDWKGRYLLELSARADGSSRFEAGHRWAFFPSMSAGWRVSDESWFKPLKNVVSNLKIRYSYGSLGNQQMSSYYPYYEVVTSGSTVSYSLDNQYLLTGASVSNPVSSALTWETVTTNNIGLDLGLFDGRLSFTGEAYIRDTKNMLTNSITLPSVYGASTPQENCADLRTTGYELYLSWNDAFQLGGDEFRYTLSGTFGDYISRITRYNNPDKLLSDRYEGQVLGEIWGYHVDGLFSSDEEAAEYMSQINSSAVQGNIFGSTNADEAYLRAGDVRYADLNDDGVISMGANTADNPGDRVVIGNSRPRYLYSMRGDMSWKNFDFSIFFQGVGHRDWYPPEGDRAYLFWGPYCLTPTAFIHKDFESMCWSEDNPDAYFPRRRNKQAHNGSALGTRNDRYIQNIGYLRLKNLSVGYTIPFKGAVPCKLRIALVGENLYYWSPLKKYCKTMDPELAAGTGTYNSNSGVGYTYPKTYTLNLTLTF